MSDPLSGRRPSMSFGSALASMKKSHTLATPKSAATVGVMSRTSSFSAKSTKKEQDSGTTSTSTKKLSEKGKLKLAQHRATEALEAETARLEQVFIEQHPELIDENGQIEIPGVDELFADNLTHDERYEQFVQQERRQIENETMVRKLSKLQRKHNTMQNALLRGNRVASGYDRDEIDLKVVQRELRKTKEKEARAIIVLEEAIPLIRDATNAAAVGQKALLAYLSQENVLMEFRQSDIRYLKASLDAELERRPSPINFRTEILWRFACTIHEFKKGDREVNLRLAQHVYNKLIERCDPELHPFQYAALHNTLELCEIEMERVTGYKIVNRANRDFEFAPLQDPSTNFNFEQKLKEREREKERELREKERK